jgi:hypothetical protein
MDIESRPRSQRFNRAKFVKALQAAPRTRIEILYDKNDIESYHFADGFLTYAFMEAGWDVVGCRAVREDDIPNPGRLSKAEADWLKQNFDPPLLSRLFTAEPANNSFAIFGGHGLGSPTITSSITNSISPEEAMQKALFDGILGAVRISVALTPRTPG